MKYNFLLFILLTLIFLNPQSAVFAEENIKKCTSKASSDLYIELDVQKLKDQLLKIKEGTMQPNLNNSLESSSIDLNNEYLLSTGDSLSLKIFEEVELSDNNILIKDDGYASFPLIGEVFVVQKSLRQVESILNKKYKIFILNPIVNIKIKSAKDRVVMVYGAVNTPGEYKCYKKNMTLREALKRAGGLTLNADLKQVKVNQKKINLLDVPLSAEIYLKSNDYIYVKSKKNIISDNIFMKAVNNNLMPETYTVKVLGNVNQPGEYQINIDNSKVSDALSAAGGISRYIGIHKIILKREDAKGKIKKIRVKANNKKLLLRPNDTLVISQSLKNKLIKEFLIRTNKLAKIFLRLKTGR